jgi:hypothetical protein
MLQMASEAQREEKYEKNHIFIFLLIFLEVRSEKKKAKNYSGKIGRHRKTKI